MNSLFYVRSKKASIFYSITFIVLFLPLLARAEITQPTIKSLQEKLDNLELFFTTFLEKEYKIIFGLDTQWQGVSYPYWHNIDFSQTNISNCSDLTDLNNFVVPTPCIVHFQPQKKDNKDDSVISGPIKIGECSPNWMIDSTGTKIIPTYSNFDACSAIFSHYRLVVEILRPQANAGL